MPNGRPNGCVEIILRTNSNYRAETTLRAEMSDCVETILRVATKCQEKAVSHAVKSRHTETILRVGTDNRAEIILRPKVDLRVKTTLFDAQAHHSKTGRLRGDEPSRRGDPPRKNEFPRRDSSSEDDEKPHRRRKPHRKDESPSPKHSPCSSASRPTKDQDDSRSSAKPQRPKAFTGKAEDLAAWLQTFENWAVAAGAKPSEWSCLAMTFLSDDTREYMQFETKSTVLPPFPRFKDLLMSKYLGVDPETLYTRLIGEAVQGPTESLLTYALRFRRLVTLANASAKEISVMTAVTQFIEGLRDPQTKAFLTRKRLQDRGQLLQSCTKPSASLLDDYISLGRMCESSVDSMPTKSSARPKAAVLAVHSSEAADEPTPASKSAAPSAASIDLNALAKSLVPLLAQPAPAKQASSSSSGGPPGQQGRTDWSKVLCFNCNKRGHGEFYCSEPRNEKLAAERKQKYESSRPSRPRSGSKSATGTKDPSAPAVTAAPPAGN